MIDPEICLVSDTNVLVPQTTLSLIPPIAPRPRFLAEIIGELEISHGNGWRKPLKCLRIPSTAIREGHHPHNRRHSDPPRQGFLYVAGNSGLTYRRCTNWKRLSFTPIPASSSHWFLRPDEELLRAPVAKFISL